MKSSQGQRLHELMTSVKLRNGKPVNVHVVYATIESLGIREVDIKEDYGFNSTMHLARKIFDKLNTPELVHLKNDRQILAEAELNEVVFLSSYHTVRQKLFVKDYSTGLIHLLPIFLQILLIIFFGFSLWTYIGFNNLQSTAVVLGVILGLVATGGFVQAIGRQVSFYWYNDDYEMSYKTTFYLLKMGVKTLLLLFSGIAIINFFIHLFPYVILLIVFIYAFLIGGVLLTLAPLYTIKRRWMISAAVLAGTLTALALKLLTTVSIYSVHWIGISVVIAIATGDLYFYFKKIIHKTGNPAHGNPKRLISIYRNFNYFTYGILFYVFLFMDRILAWSTTLDRNLPYIIYYDKDYELGMDLAILAFFLLAGVLEYSIASFSRFLEFYQRTMNYDKVEQFKDNMLKMYYRHLQIFAVSAVIISILLYFVITETWGYEAGFDEKISPLSLKVALLGGVGYLFLTLGLLNVLYCYTLNYDRKPLIALFMACLVNLVVGVLVSRTIGYEYSVLGMLAGSAAFMILTTKDTLNFFKNIDYHYYASY
jgi:hypothetical protein